jgi:hypothetical protein
MMDVIIFKHEGKCGGTSLRLSLEEVFDAEEILYVYGTPINRALFHEICYEMRLCRPMPAYLDLSSKDADFKRLFTLVNKELDNGIRLVYGHFVPLSHIVEEAISRPYRLFTMTRHPYSQQVSMYNHLRRVGEASATTRTFEEWIVNNATMAFYSVETMLESYGRYEKVLFYEEYKEGLDYMSNVIDKELKERRENTSAKYVERSGETDRLIDRYLPNHLRTYEGLRRKFKA